MDARVQRVLEHMQHAKSFVCSPARTALKERTLLTPNALDPEDERLDKQIAEIMQSFLINPVIEGALLVSTKDPARSEGVLGLLPTIANIVRAIRSASMEILSIEEHLPSWEHLPPWETLLNGQVIGQAKIQWWNRQKTPEEREGLLITAHGPAYPITHPRYQPHPSLAIIHIAAAGKIPWMMNQAIRNRAFAAVGRDYESATFLLPMTSSGEW